MSNTPQTARDFLDYWDVLKSQLWPTDLDALEWRDQCTFLDLAADLKAVVAVLVDECDRRGLPVGGLLTVAASPFSAPPDAWDRAHEAVEVLKMRLRREADGQQAVDAVASAAGPQTGSDPYSLRPDHFFVLEALADSPHLLTTVEMVGVLEAAGDGRARARNRISEIYADLARMGLIENKPRQGAKLSSRGRHFLDGRGGTTPARR